MALFKRRARSAQPDEKSTSKASAGTPRRVEPEPGIEPEEETPTGLLAWMKAVRRRFGLDRHRLMERFVLTTAVFSITLVAILGGGIAVTLSNRANQLSNQALYTSTFTSSRSNLAGEVLGMRRSPDGTRVVIWTKFASMSSMSIDANTYQVFVTGGTLGGQVKATEQLVNGEYVVYGSTGVMALVLDARDSAGNPVVFDPELLAITVRANREIADRTAELGDGENGDSFSLYDQWRLFANPGASEVETDTELTGGAQSFDATTFHLRQVTALQVEAIREKVQSQLAILRVDLARIQEYTERVTAVRYGKLGLESVETPAIVSGDIVTGKQGSLALQPVLTIASGYDFTMREDSLLEGYAEQEASTTTNTSPTQWQRETAWTLTDGMTLESLRNDKGAEDMRTAVADLEEAWSDYYTAKRVYQVELLGSLVELAQEENSIEAAISTNTSAVKTY